jgi:hypothetical protein
MKQLDWRTWGRWGATAVLAGVLAACGGSGGGGTGGGGATPTTLGGTAAVGAPIVGGDVTVKCRDGDDLVAVTSSNGSWQVTINGQALPCVAQVSGGTVGGAAQSGVFHSIAVAFGTLNITPLTNLVAAALLDQDPATWFATPEFGDDDIEADRTALTEALQRIVSALGLGDSLDGANPMTTPFNATPSDRLDAALEALAQALDDIGSNYEDLLAAAINALIDEDAFAAFVGFSAAYNGAFEVVFDPGLGGDSTLTVGISIGGAPTTTFVTLENVPAPANEAEFCADLESDSTFSSIGTEGGGTLTVNSCSFSNNVGTVDSTLTISLQGVPPTTLSYVVTYTYN